jgi:hypothetical protein
MASALRRTIRGNLFLFILVTAVSEQIIIVSHVGALILIDLCVDQVAKRSLSGNNVVFIFAQVVWNGVIGWQDSAGDCAGEIWRCLVAGVCRYLVRHVDDWLRRGCAMELDKRD